MPPVIRAEILPVFSNRIDQCAERVEAVTHQSGIFCGLPLDLLLDEKGALFALMFPGQYDQVLVLCTIPDIRSQCVADIRYALKLLIWYHVSAFSRFASIGENFTPVNPFTSQ